MSKFFSKLKGENAKRDDLAPDSSSSLASNNPYRHTQSQPPAYEPPPGPPPSHSSSSKHTDAASGNGSDDNPPPYHDWTSVPDTALLPPPPAIVNEYSSTTNATYDEAAAGHAWCARNPVYQPTVPNVHLIETVRAGQHNLDSPQDFRGTLTKLSPSHSSSSFTPNSFGATPTTIFHLSSAPTSSSSSSSSSSSTTTTHSPSPFSRHKKPPSNPPPTDQTHLTRLPLYFASTSSPLSPHFSNPKQSPTTIYFEIRPLSFSTTDSTVSLGFASKPYPPTRQPGWHRASLAVHSDDGNRYVNDPWGGQPFTTPFRAGETLGLALQILPEPPATAPAGRPTLQSEREVRSGLPRCKTRVFFTRNGTVEGGWDVDEERDAERDEGVAGLMGEVDLYGAVGTFGGVEVEVRFFACGEGFVAPPGGG